MKLLLGLALWVAFRVQWRRRMHYHTLLPPITAFRLTKKVEYDVYERKILKGGIIYLCNRLPEVPRKILPS